jgi:hypothetical protein
MLIDVAVDEERDVGGGNEYGVDGDKFHYATVFRLFVNI